MKYCTSCGTQLLDKAVVCVKCGSRVQSSNFGISPSIASSKKTNKKIIIGIYGLCGAIGIFGGLVPAIGVIIISICLYGIQAGLIVLVAGIVLLLINRGQFWGALVILGVITAIYISFMKLGLIEDITFYIKKIKTLSF